MRLAKGITCAALHLYFTAYFPVDALEAAWFPRMKFLHKCAPLGAGLAGVLAVHSSGYNAGRQ